MEKMIAWGAGEYTVIQKQYTDFSQMYSKKHPADYDVSNHFFGKQYNNTPKNKKIFFAPYFFLKTCIIVLFIGQKQ